MSATTIELDVSTPWEPPEPPRRRAGARRSLDRWRLAGALAAVVVVASCLVASGPPVDRAPLLTAYDASAEFQVAGDRLFLISAHPDGMPTVRMYTLPDTRPRWEATYVAGASLWRAQGDQLFRTRFTEPEPQPRVIAVEAVDAASGALMWSRAGAAFFGVVDDLAVLLERSVDDDGRLERMFAVDRRTGDSRWSLPRPFSDDRLWTVAEEPDGQTRTLVEVTADGRVSEWDLRTGESRGTVQLALAAAPQYAQVSAGTLVVGQGHGDGYHTVRGYDLRTGALRWRTDGPDGGYPCGIYLCTLGTEQMIVVDPRTGRQIPNPGTHSAIAFGRRLLVSTDLRRSDHETWSVLDGATGVSLPLTAWGSPSVVDDRRVVMASFRPADRRGLVAVVGPDPGAADVFGQLDTWYSRPECTVAERYVICAGSPQFAVWLLPDGLRRGPDRW